VHPVLFHAGSVLIPSYGAVAALGVVLALLLAQHAARVLRLNPNQLWNLCVIGLFAAMVGSRVFLLLVNWRVLLRHPSWIFILAMIHHPLVGAAGALSGAACAWLYARWQRLPVMAAADAITAPLALGLAFEQIGELLSGSGYGIEAGAGLPWAVTYTDPLTARWSGTPLGVPLHPVQAYAALGFLVLAIFLIAFLPRLKRRGDAVGLWMLGAGVTIFVSELWRDRVGHGSLFGGALDGPQIAAIALVLCGGVLLSERKRRRHQIDAGADGSEDTEMAETSSAARDTSHE
jgi:phosphatidylglycerol:prolipoprotein diacylglycerol transferase